VFTGKHQVQRSHNSDLMKKTKTQSSTTGATTKGSVVKSSTKPMQNQTATKNKVAKETGANQKERCSYLNKSLR
jgi:hypothetical protein